MAHVNLEGGEDDDNSNPNGSARTKKPGWWKQWMREQREVYSYDWIWGVGTISS